MGARLLRGLLPAAVAARALAGCAVRAVTPEFRKLVGELSGTQ